MKNGWMYSIRRYFIVAAEVALQKRKLPPVVKIKKFSHTNGGLETVLLVPPYMMTNWVSNVNGLGILELGILSRYVDVLILMMVSNDVLTPSYAEHFTYPESTPEHVRDMIIDKAGHAAYFVHHQSEHNRLVVVAVRK